MLTINPTIAHAWDVPIAQARDIQLALKEKVIRQDRLKKTLSRVAGVDVGFEDNGKITRAAVAVLDFPSLELMEYAIARRDTRFPYVPGYLSFRETPAVLDALQKLSQLPEVLLCDGQGVAHPRRFGLACHIGVLTEIPTIGVAKTRFIGTHATVPEEKGGYVSLMDHGEEIGAVLRTRKGVKPVYVSIGHRISLPTAIHLVMQCVTKYRLPETTRWSDRIASNKTGDY
ncbi:MAG: deoxyribonuclease V [Gammaproteobacteria bacterium]|jgi:deoxyribonuclease V|nr:deoxyribonuclease V [Gammaproteobacteria bacterium]